MSTASPLLSELLDALRCLPGVGARSAQRMAYHLLERDRKGGERLAVALQAAMQRIGNCVECRSFSESERCALCAGSTRERGQLCVVETPADLAAIEQATGYRGLYFVLLGRFLRWMVSGPRNWACRCCSGAWRRARCGNSSSPPIPPSRARPPRTIWPSWRRPRVCASAVSPMACRWAASWNTSIAVRWRTPSAAAFP